MERYCQLCGGPLMAVGDFLKYWITFYQCSRRAQLTKLDNQKHDLEAEIKEFEGTRNELRGQIERARADLAVKQVSLSRIKPIVLELLGADADMHRVTKPTINTFLLFNKVALWSRRMTDMSPVFVHILEGGISQPHRDKPD